MAGTPSDVAADLAMRSPRPAPTPDLPASMLAMAIDNCSGQLTAVRKLTPLPGKGELLVRVPACGVCRTDLGPIDNDLPARHGGTLPGHEIVGRVVALGVGPARVSVGQRVGIPWLGKA